MIAYGKFQETKAAERTLRGTENLRARAQILLLEVADLAIIGGLELPEDILTAIAEERCDLIRNHPETEWAADWA